MEADNHGMAGRYQSVLLTSLQLSKIDRMDRSSSSQLVTFISTVFCQ